MKGLLTLKDLKTEKIIEIIEYASKIKNGYKVSYPGKKVVTLFYENSTRTHFSFQCALMNLGISVLQCDTGKSSAQKGESLYDTVKTFESLGVDGVVIRSSQDEYFKELVNNEKYGHFELPIYGIHQLMDALAVISICYYENIDPNEVEKHWGLYYENRTPKLMYRN